MNLSSFLFSILLLQIILHLTTAQPQTLTCSKGEYIYNESSSFKLCMPCQLNCQECTSSTFCTECNPHYFYHKAGKQCVIDTVLPIENCGDIVDINAENITCSDCLNGFWLTSSGICMPCILTECISWEQGTTQESCSEVKPGYSLINGTIQNCSKIDQNCLECASSTQCTACSESYYLSTSNACLLKEGNCKKWKLSLQEECESCYEGYSIHPIEKSICYQTQCLNQKCGNGKARISYPICNLQCTDENCLDCDQQDDNEKSCKECKEGYQMQGGECLEEIKGCILIGSDGKCLQCQDGFYEVEEGCNECKEGCVCDNEEGCDRCIAGFYFLQEESQCLKCADEKCIDCGEKQDECLQCKSGYQMINKACIENTIENCQEQESEYVCSGCIDGYYLESNGVCISCDYSKYIHISCTEYQFTKFPFTCTNLTDNCYENQATPLIGDEQQQCQSCLCGYRLTSTGDCVACNGNCSQCNEEECEECLYGYYLKDGECVECEENCLQCVPTEIGICQECEEGYTFEENDEGKKCVKLVVENCKRSFSPYSCSQCYDGYYLINEQQCEQCSTNCTSCIDNSTCYTCQIGTYLSQAQCLSCFDNCINCEEASVCLECEKGYVLCAFNTSCERINQTAWDCIIRVPGCIKCNQDSSEVCMLCQYGSKPVNGKCQCGEGEELFSEECIGQMFTELPEEIDINEMSSYLNKINQNKNGEIQKVLEVIQEFVDQEEIENSDAETILQLLVYFAENASSEKEEELFKSILENICNISYLKETNYYAAFIAADYHMKITSNIKEIYQLGFQTCLNNLLKKYSISEIPPMQLANTELTISELSGFDKYKKIQLTDVEINLPEEFLLQLDRQLTIYAIVQTIDIRANPYQNEQKNENKALSSKIVRFSLSSGGPNGTNYEIQLPINKTFDITFNDAGNSSVCGYYNISQKDWIVDGTRSNLNCSYDHLTDFAMIVDKSNFESMDNDDSDSSTTLWIVLVILFVICLIGITILLVLYIQKKKKAKQNNSYQGEIAKNRSIDINDKKKFNLNFEEEEVEK